MDSYERMYPGLFGSDHRSFFDLQSLDHRKYICPCDHWSSAPSTLPKYVLLEENMTNISNTISSTQPTVFVDDRVVVENEYLMEGNDFNGYQNKQMRTTPNEDGDGLMAYWSAVAGGCCVLLLLLLITSICVAASRVNRKKHKRGKMNATDEIVLNNMGHECQSFHADKPILSSMARASAASASGTMEDAGWRMLNEKGRMNAINHRCYQSNHATNPQHSLLVHFNDSGSLRTCVSKTTTPFCGEHSTYQDTR